MYIIFICIFLHFVSNSVHPWAILYSHMRWIFLISVNETEVSKKGERGIKWTSTDEQGASGSEQGMAHSTFLSAGLQIEVEPAEAHDFIMDHIWLRCRIDFSSCFFFSAFYVSIHHTTLCSVLTVLLSFLIHIPITFYSPICRHFFPAQPPCALNVSATDWSSLNDANCVHTGFTLTWPGMSWLLNSKLIHTTISMHLSFFNILPSFCGGICYDISMVIIWEWFYFCYTCHFQMQKCFILNTKRHYQRLVTHQKNEIVSRSPLKLNLHTEYSWRFTS